MYAHHAWLQLLEFWHGATGLLLQPLEVAGIVGLLYVYVEAAAFGGLAVVLASLLISHQGGAVVSARYMHCPERMVLRFIPAAEWSPV
jgi:hypothetical protein